MIPNEEDNDKSEKEQDLKVLSEQMQPNTPSQVKGILKNKEHDKVKKMLTLQQLSTQNLNQDYQSDQGNTTPKSLVSQNEFGGCYSETRSPNKQKSMMIQRFKTAHRLSMPEVNLRNRQKSKTVVLSNSIESGSALQKKKVQIAGEPSSSSSSTEFDKQKVSKFEVQHKSMFFKQHMENETEMRLSNCNFFDIYEQLNKSGEGAHGIVYQVRHRCTQQVYAAKLYRTMDEELILNIRNELEVLKHLSHPGIMKVFELIEYPEQGVYVLLMEYLDSISLKQFCEARTVFLQQEIQFVLKQVIDAVRYLHSQGVSHRDLHADNILIDKNSKILKIIDFNVSKQGGQLFGSDHDLFYTPTGVPKYRAPECNEGSYSEKNDIWMLGLIAYRLFTNLDLSTNKALRKIKNHSLFTESDTNSQGSFNKTIQLATVDDPVQQDLLLQLLTVEPKDRISASDALNHQYFSADYSQLDKENLIQAQLANPEDQIKQFQHPQILSKSNSHTSHTSEIDTDVIEDLKYIA